MVSLDKVATAMNVHALVHAQIVSALKVLQREGADWRIRAYHVSKVITDH